MSSKDFFEVRALAGEEKLLHVVDDGPIALRIMDIAGGASVATVVLSDTSSTLTLTDSAAAATAIDLSDGAYDTVGELADYINGLASWSCKVLDALRSDATDNVYADGAVSVGIVDGESVFDVASDTSALASLRLAVMYNRSIADGTKGSHRVVLKDVKYNADLTAAAGGIKIYEVTNGGKTETQVFSALSVDTTDTSIDLGDGITAGEGNSFVICVDGTVIDAGANFLQAQYKKE